tara:strand:- start:3124 stop:3588 length:465 start_codon:yes stop_codon:yes gene_type:complete
MGYNGSYGGGGSGGGSIAKDMYFADITARDISTTNNPDRIKQGIVCAVTNGTEYDYYQWDNIGSQWREANGIYQGKTGEKGDGVDFFTVAMDGLSSDLFVNHNLGRPVAVAKLYTPDGKISDVYVENLDESGQGSTNTAWVSSSIPMLGTLTLI